MQKAVRRRLNAAVEGIALPKGLDERYGDLFPTAGTHGNEEETERLVMMLNLYLVRGLSTMEIAKLLNMSEKAASEALLRLLARAKRLAKT